MALLVVSSPRDQASQRLSCDQLNSKPASALWSMCSPRSTSVSASVSRSKTWMRCVWSMKASLVLSGAQNGR